MQRLGESTSHPSPTAGRWGTPTVWVRGGRTDRGKGAIGGLSTRFASVEMSHFLGGVRIRGNGRAGWGGSKSHPSPRWRRMGHPRVGALGRTYRGKAQCGGLSTALAFGRDVAIFWVGENKRQRQSWRGGSTPTLSPTAAKDGAPARFGRWGEQQSKGAMPGGSHCAFASVEMSHLLEWGENKRQRRAGWGDLHPTLRQRPRRMGHPPVCVQGGRQKRHKARNAGGLSLRFASVEMTHLWVG